MEDLNQYVTHELIQYVWSHLRHGSPNATSIDAEMVVGRVLRGEGDGIMVMTFRVNPGMADELRLHIRHSVVHVRAVARQHSI